MYTMATQHFDTTYVSIWLAISSLICFFLYQLISTVYASKKIEWLTEDRANQLCKNMILIGTLLLAAFLLYYMFVFRPDAIQAQVGQLQLDMAGRNDIMEILI